MCNVYQDNKVCDIQKNTTTTPQSLIFPSSFPTQNWNRKDQIAFQCAVSITHKSESLGKICDLAKLVKQMKTF